MKWEMEMEILSPASYLSGTTRSTKWTSAENKMFENALAVYDKDTSDRWQKVAAMIPGKTVGDVIKQYRELEADVSSIEAGLVPVPGYSTSQFTLDWVSSHGYDGLKQSYGFSGRRCSTGRPAEHERKKGIPWTEEEHKLFLMGLKKYGKGDWRNISRNFVVTRTPTQVASHAQKYFIRQLSGGKDKRRASIHDITTVNLNDAGSPSPDNKGAPLPEKSSMLPHQPDSASISGTCFRWNQPCGGVTMAFNSTQGNTLMSSVYGIPSYGSLHRSAAYESYFGPQNLVFQTQPAQQYPHG